MATVLYVDDEGAIRRAVRSWLTRKGHVVYEAESAAAARTIVLAHRLDGIFIDVWLGADSGLELLRWVEELDEELGRRVAFVTGDIFHENSGATGDSHPVYAKPFELRDLELQVEAWVRERSAEGDRRQHRILEPRGEDGGRRATS